MLKSVFIPLCFCWSLAADPVYFQTNLTSNIPGLAAYTDANLINPWGASFSPTSPIWVSDEGTNVATLYEASGAPVSLVVSTKSPTGQVFNGSSSFTLSDGSAAKFIFASTGGTISGWNAGAGTTAITEFTATDGAMYTGLANGNNGSEDLLYAADFKNGRIDVFDSSFSLTSLSGNFADPNLPAGFEPYNIQNIGGELYVEYTNAGTIGSAGDGVVDVFDLNGNFVKRFATGGTLDAPWGVTMAPASFGGFGGDLLIGNFGNGMIDAFNPTSGAFLGTISDASGNPIVNDGLWSLSFRDGGGFDADALYFTAGINNQQDGLFGEIQPTPEPFMWPMLALGFGLVAVAGWKKSKSC